MLSEKEIIERIEKFFEDNYEIQRLEVGHALTEDVKRLALNQVIYYYKKMKELAEKVTETEVKLALPEQKTPKGRTFTIEGIVDIVREESETWMYDIKTHDSDYIIENRKLYEKQLNVYAHIWQQLRGELLNHTAIISTSIPNSLKEAIRFGEQSRIDFEIKRWNPVIPIPFHQQKIDETVKEFAEVVDEIENKNFKPASVQKLSEVTPGTKDVFAGRVCRNCDARFSCNSFRRYAIESGGKFALKKYFEDFRSDSDREEWVSYNLEATDFSSFAD